ncbi:MAG: hypothetical protein AB1716_05450 [Planctomycetota bacterium]
MDARDRISLWHKADGGLREIWQRGYADKSWPPHMAYVADDGQRVILRDVHHCLGYGKCLVFLDAKGEVLRGYELRDFLTDYEVLYTKTTVSSRWWSEPGWFALRDMDRQFALVTAHGTIRCFDTRTGEQKTVDDALKSQIVKEATASARQWLSDSEPHLRESGAKLLGVLGAHDAIPALTAAFRDETVTGTGTVGSSGSGPIHGVKLAAAEALLRLSGAEALELIVPELESGNSYMQAALLSMLSLYPEELESGPQPPVPIATWERLARDASEPLRTQALQNAISSGGAAYVREHTDLLRSERLNVRFAAVRALAERPLPSDVPLLRAALEDSDSINQLLAWRALVRLNPPEVTDLLRWGKEQKDRTIRFETTLELARRHDDQAIREILDGVRALEDHAHQKEGWGTREMEAQALCEVVAELKLKQAEAPLRGALHNDCPNIQLPVAGALAVLGDTEALARVREFARRGHALDRASAIEWLGRADDRASLTFLRHAAEDEEPWVRAAAKKVLSTLDTAASRPTSLPN